MGPAEGVGVSGVHCRPAGHVGESGVSGGQQEV